MDKPFKGTITKATRSPCGEHGLGYMIWGTFKDHPSFAGKHGHTSYVVWEGEVMDEDGSYEIETLNSRYIVIPA